ncbi:MAG: serine/threonine protein kinase [Fibrobacter sp.]|nr:serine/threonine protein kinase [Fibrobacter sp.]
MQKFGRYEVIKLIGEGAMGRVFLAEDPVLKRLVAIKVIALDRFYDDNTKEEFLKRFSLEALASARLNHPSIVTIYDTGDQDGIPWIAFEYIKGESLDICIKKNGFLQFDQICSIVSQIASALGHAHQNGIIHRDIKPSNILIDSHSGIAKLSDFGVVKAPDIGLTQSGSSVGSPGYMSPEQIEGSKVDFRSDLFSLGVVIYEMITGKHPFIRETVPATFYATLNGEFTPLQKIREDTPANLIQIVSNLLDPQKEKRTLNTEQISALVNKDQTGSSSINEHPEVNRLLQPPENLFSFFVHQFLKVITEKKRSFSKNTHFFHKLLNSIYFLKDQLIKKLSPCLKSTLINLKNLSPFNFPVNRLLPVLITIVFIITLLISGNFLMRNSKQMVLPPDISEKLEYFIENGLADSARFICDTLEKDYALWGYLYRGLIEFCENNYSESSVQFELLINYNGKELLDNKIPYMRNEIEKRFKKGNVPEELISLAANILSLQNDSVFLQLLGNEHYWTRWNTAKVVVAGGEKIDSVSLFILDYETARTYKTRIAAVEKMGRSEDPRVIPYLEKAAARSFRDPFVASKAKKYLGNFAKNKLSGATP